VFVHACIQYMQETPPNPPPKNPTQKGDVYWCTADCGWITGHSYLTYGPLLVGGRYGFVGSAALAWPFWPNRCGLVALGFGCGCSVV
jgi:hypothetical protein